MQIGTAGQEREFWISMEEALNKLAKQSAVPEVQATVQILRNCKRYSATVTFEEESGLRVAQEKVANYLVLLRDFPGGELPDAKSIPEMTQIVHKSFDHIYKSSTVFQAYSYQRLWALGECMGRDLRTVMLNYLRTLKLMHAPLKDFVSVVKECKKLDEFFVVQVTSVIKDYAKKVANPTEMPFSFTFFHKNVNERLESLYNLRQGHQRFSDAISTVFNEGTEDGIRFEREVEAAYSVFLRVDCLDNQTTAGRDKYENTVKAYDQLVSELESGLVVHLKGLVGNCQSDDERSALLKRFNPLFYRKRIRSTIEQLQTTMLQKIREDLESLREKFKTPYSDTGASKLASIRDIQSHVSPCVWARRFELRLCMLKQRVKDVLGDGYDRDQSGRQLMDECMSFADRLNLKNMADDCGDKFMQESLALHKPLFAIETNESTGRTLVADYDERIPYLFKEYRMFKANYYRLPFSGIVMASRAQQIYPHAVIMTQSMRAYNKGCKLIESYPRIAPLVTKFQAEVHEYIIGKGLSLHWQHPDMAPFVKGLVQRIYNFSDRVSDLVTATKSVELLIQKLSEIRLGTDCHESFFEVAKKLQEHVAHMELQSLANMGPWVDGVVERVEHALMERVQEMARLWIEELESFCPDRMNHVATSKHSVGTTSLLATATTETTFKMALRPYLGLQLTPPIEAAHGSLLRSFHTCLSYIVNIPRLRTGSFDIDNNNDAAAAATAIDQQQQDDESVDGAAQSPEDAPEYQDFRDVLQKMDNAEIFDDAYERIDSVVDQLQDAVQGWISYSALWDVDISSLFSELEGDDISRWLKKNLENISGT